MPLKYLINIVLSVADNENNINKDGNVNNIIFTIKDTKLVTLVVTLSPKDNQKLSKRLGKDLKNQITGMNIKQKLK